MHSHAADSDTPNKPDNLRAPVALWLLFGFGSYPAIQSGFLGGLTWGAPLRVMAR